MIHGRHVTAHFAGFYLAYCGASPSPSVNLIRSWVHRRKVLRVGTDEWGYALYDLTQIIDYARVRGMLDEADAAALLGEDACL